jgi:hypothetical protein
MQKTNNKLSILILARFIPFPLVDGGKICIFNFIDYLRKYHDFTILIPLHDPEDYKGIAALKEMWPDVSVEYSELFKPVENYSISIEDKPSLLKRGYWFTKRVVKKMLTKPATTQEHVAQPNEINLFQDIEFTLPFYPFPENYVDKLTGLLNNRKYDIIHVTLTRNLNLINLLPTDSINVFEQIEARYEVLRDYSETKNVSKAYSDYVVKNTETIENFLMSKYDAVFTLTEKDEKHLKKVMPSQKVYSSPFGVLNKDIHKPDHSSTPNKIVFSGNEGHYPNVDAIMWYIENIHAKVFELTKLKLYITGKWSDSSIQSVISKYPNVEFAGFVDDYAAFIKNSIVIVPNRIGGGLRTKILYAMGNGVPVVSSSIAKAGIDATHGKEILIADTPLEFIKNIELLVKDKELLQRISNDAFLLINEKYSQTSTSELRNRFYLELFNAGK